MSYYIYTHLYYQISTVPSWFKNNAISHHTQQENMEDFNLAKVLTQSAVHYNSLLLFSDPLTEFLPQRVGKFPLVFPRKHIQF